MANTKDGDVWTDEELKLACDTKKQYRTPKVSVGTVKKSIAAMASR